MILKSKRTGNTDIYYLLPSFFILTFIYFYWFGDYVLFFQEKQSLFIFSGEYLHEYLIKPGGLLELAGNFLTQFYLNTANGALILSAILTVPLVILFKINKRLFSDRAFLLLSLLVPSCLLLLMQSHYYHSMEYNLGFLSVLLYFSFSILPGKKQSRYIALALFPLFYYLIGAYIWIFLGMFIVFSLSHEKGRLRFVYAVFLVIIAAVSILVFKAFLFLQPFDQLFRYPLPLERPIIDVFKHKIFFYLLTGYVIFYPLLSKTSFLLKIKKKLIKPISVISILIAFLLTFFLLSKLYNKQTSRVLHLQEFVLDRKWNEVIEFHENYPSKNLIGQYFYNIALSETDQLCDKLFFGRQDFGVKSLILPWDNDLTQINRGAYFPYSIGLINEAHQWAYVSMVVYGYRPQNLKLLVKTNLISGNYRMAKKYIDKLKKSLNYISWAKEYEKMLYKPALIQSHPELGEKIKLLPNEDFFIQSENPQNNLPLLLNANQTNRKAFEYQIAWFLLNKNIEEAAKHIKKMKKMGYTRIPRHVEEAALVYYDLTGNIPELGGLKISLETQLRFRQYVTIYKSMRQNPSVDNKTLRDQFGNTFWFYFHFKSF
jgi:Family of unknown function (DUF6057)